MFSRAKVKRALTLLGLRERTPLPPLKAQPLPATLVIPQVSLFVRIGRDELHLAFNGRV